VIITLWLSQRGRQYLFYLNTAPTSEASASCVITEGRTATVGELVFFAIASLRSLVCLLVGGGNNLGGKGEVRTQVINTFIGQVAVVVLPREGNANVVLGRKRLHQTEDFQVVGSFDVRMLVGLGVLLDDAYSLLEEVRVDSDTVFLGDEHDDWYFARRIYFKVRNTKRGLNYKSETVDRDFGSEGRSTK